MRRCEVDGMIDGYVSVWLVQCRTWTYRETPIHAQNVDLNFINKYRDCDSGRRRQLKTFQNRLDIRRTHRNSIYTILGGLKLNTKWYAQCSHLISIN